MKFYFDIIETNVKTVSIEANDLSQALKKVEEAYEKKEFVINRELPDDIEFKNVTSEVENLIKETLITEEEIEEVN